MRIRGSLATGIAVAMAIGTAGIATAHAPGVADGHVPANTNYGIRPVGYSPLEGVQDGRYTDVWTLGDTAYVGSFQDPTCSRDGVYIADISDPTAPSYLGQIPSSPNTRVNDVKAITIGDQDVLIFSHESCGRIVGQPAASDQGVRNGKVAPGGSIQQGKEGISLYDVTDPSNPEPLKKGFLKTEVHNTFPWQTDDGTFLLVVDDFNADDLWIVDISKPAQPKLLLETGLGTWLSDADTAADIGDQLAFGTFPFPLLHDVWVEYNQEAGRWEAVLSYWDAGFITLDVSDPGNPVFLGDSDYPEEDPILASHRETLFDGFPEGNAHAAVFGGDDNEFIFGGDEDFDAEAVTVANSNAAVPATTGSDTPPVPGPLDPPIEGDLVFVGEACSGIDAAASPDDIALIERGTCAFTTKAGVVEAAGYAAGVVFNRVGPDVTCATGISMLVEGGIPMVSTSRADGLALMDEECVEGQAVADYGIAEGAPFGSTTLSSDFVGWGYFWALNNTMELIDVPGTMSGPDGTTRDIGYLGNIGYYAPAEVADDTLASGSGDLSMHNLETDVQYRDRSFISWYSLGMRAVEWRPGHFHDGESNGDFYSWNIHEVGRWIAGDPALEPDSHLELAHFAAQHDGIEVDDLAGSNFWGVTQYVDGDGNRFILGSDRSTGLWIFEYDCDDDPDEGGPLYCGDGNSD